MLAGPPVPMKPLVHGVDAMLVVPLAGHLVFEGAFFCVAIVAGAGLIQSAGEDHVAGYHNVVLHDGIPVLAQISLLLEYGSPKSLLW